jgi:integrase
LLQSSAIIGIVADTNCPEMPNSKKRKRWPEVVRIGSARALIYRTRERKIVGRRSRSYERFTVTYYRTDGVKQIRCRRSFSSLQDARFEAGRAATAIANGEADILKLTSADRATYLRAMDALRPLGIQLHVAIEEYVEARQHAGAGLIAAAKEHGRRHVTTTVRKSIAETVKEILEAKKQDGMSVRYLQSLRSHLSRFAEHFRMNIATVTAMQIEDWLRRSKRGPRTRNNIRLSIVTLFNFAKARGYLPKTVPTEADHVAKAKDRGGEIGTFTPAQLADLLNIGDEEAKLYFAIGAFTGLRSAELIRLEWEDVNFARGHIQVGKAKAKTATRRLVPIQPNLEMWLAPYRANRGMIFASEHAAKRAIAQAKGAGIGWPNNVLRHSYATYRLAQCKDAARVALEMGNSPQMLFRNYRELVDEKDAADWFNIVPSEAASKKIIPLRRAR